MRNPLRGVLRKSFLERNPLLIGALGVALLVVFSALGLLLQGGAFKSTYDVTAYFRDAAAIKPDDYVTVAGLQAGKVSDVRIARGKVAVDLAVDSAVEVPHDSGAAIKMQTLLGRKVIELIPGSSERPLKDGDVIPESRTRTPVTVEDLNTTSVDLLRKSDAKAFDRMLQEITRVTKGKRRRLGELIDGLGRVAKAIDVKQEALSRLIDSMQTLGSTFADKDDVIVSLIDRLDAVLHNLALHRDDLARLVTETDAASHEVADLVHRNRDTLDSSLNNLHTTLQVIDRHQLDLAATIGYLHDSVRGYSSIGYSKGIPNRWANIYVQSLGPVGVDAISGCGGILDHALDELLGPAPCHADYSGGRSQRGGTPGAPPSPLTPPGDGGSPGPLPGTPGLPAPPLPGSVGDLVDSLTGTVGGGLQ